MATAGDRFETIARRELGVRDSAEIVTVELGRPYEDNGPYGCPLRISFRDCRIEQVIFGEDGFQALILALKIIPTFLEHTDDLPKGRMFWLEPTSDTGFSLSKSEYYE